MPIIDIDGFKVWRRDPFAQTLARDLIGMEATYARSCTASREYYIVKVPILSYDVLTDVMEVDTSKCSEEQSRFIYGNVTPREHERNENEGIRHDTASCDDRDSGPASSAVADAIAAP